MLCTLNYSFEKECLELGARSARLEYLANLQANSQGLCQSNELPRKLSQRIIWGSRQASGWAQLNVIWLTKALLLRIPAQTLRYSHQTCAPVKPMVKHVAASLEAVWARKTPFYLRVIHKLRRFTCLWSRGTLGIFAWKIDTSSST